MKLFSRPRAAARFDVPLTSAEIEKIFAGCGDFQLRAIYPGGEKLKGVSAAYIDGVVSSTDVAQNVIRPLTESSRVSSAKSARELIDLMLRGAVYNGAVKLRETADDVVSDILNGSCAVIVDRERKAVTFEARTGEHRSITEPKNEKTVKGAKDAFVETLRINTALTRQRLRDSDLKLKNVTVGRRSATTVAVMYMESIADPALPEELVRRLGAIDTDGAINTGDIEEYIVDCPSSPFPQLIMTERSDKFVRHLLDGRVGFIFDGIPLGFLVPASLPQIMETTDEVSQHFAVASAIKLLRYAAFAISLLLPAFSVSVAMYHQEMIPLRLLLSIIEAEQKVPFTVAGEVLGMLVSFELLQEAGLRLPDPIGDTVSIIGALIVGQSAVAADVISPISVIIVAMTGISGYALPNRDLGAALRLFRLLLVVAAVFLGIFGVVLGAVLVLYHICGIESFGVPYTAPATGGGAKGKLKTLLRLPLSAESERDAQLHPRDIRRRK